MTSFFDRACRASIVVGQQNYSGLVTSRDALVWVKTDEKSCPNVDTDAVTIMDALRASRTSGGSVTLLHPIPCDGPISIEGVVHRPLEGRIEPNKFSQFVYSQLRQIYDARDSHQGVIRPCGDQLWFVPTDSSDYMTTLRRKRAVKMLPFSQEDIDLLGYAYVCLSPPRFLSEDFQLREHEHEYIRLTRCIRDVLRYDADKLIFDAIDVFVAYTFANGRLHITGISFDLSSVASFPTMLFEQCLPIFIESIVEAAIAFHDWHDEFRLCISKDAVFDEHRHALGFDGDGCFDIRASSDECVLNYGCRIAALDSKGRLCSLTTRIASENYEPLTSILDDCAPLAGTEPSTSRPKKTKKKKKKIANDHRSVNAEGACEETSPPPSHSIIDEYDETCVGSGSKPPEACSWGSWEETEVGRRVYERDEDLVYRLSRVVPTHIMDKFLMSDLAAIRRSHCVGDILDDQVKRDLRACLPEEVVSTFLQERYDPVCSIMDERSTSSEEVLRECLDRMTSEC